MAPWIQLYLGFTDLVFMAKEELIKCSFSILFCLYLAVNGLVLRYQVFIQYEYVKSGVNC